MKSQGKSKSMRQRIREKVWNDPTSVLDRYTMRLKWGGLNFEGNPPMAKKPGEIAAERE